MQVTVFGANGKVGTHVVRSLLDDGYTVKAFIYGAHQFSENPNLEIIKGNIYNASDVEQSLVGSDTVISALGSWRTPKKDILTEGMKNIIPAMKTIGITRIISLTGADARAEGDKLSVIHRISRSLLWLIAPKVLHDGEEHIRLLQGSALQWTVLRSPVMNERGSSAYGLSNNRSMPWKTIHRHAVARALINQISVTDELQNSPYLARK